MLIFVKTLKGESIPLDVNLKDSVSHIKELIQVATTIPATEQSCSFGAVLLEDTRLLSDYIIQHESTIHLVWVQNNIITSIH